MASLFDAFEVRKMASLVAWRRMKRRVNPPDVLTRANRPCHGGTHSAAFYFLFLVESPPFLSKVYIAFRDYVATFHAYELSIFSVG
jgi:hypothetical protein